jgi:hypothetical protein
MPALTGDEGRDASQPDIPAELSLRQAAATLGVDKKTVQKYIAAGLLEWRDAAPPNSSRPLLRVKRDSVVKLRTTYRTGPASPPTIPAKREYQQGRLSIPNEALPRHICLRRG